jgi:predicted amino acid dehydrogenase
MSLPYLGSSSRRPSFCFVVHPRDEEDIFHATCLSLLREMSDSDADFVARALKIPPTILGEITVGFSWCRGELITIGCLPRDVPSVRGRREIVRAAQIAVDRGAAVIGLGALTSPCTDGGRMLVDELPSGATVTNGNAYTAAVLRANVVEASEALGLDRPARVAVIGCTGSVGSAVCRLLAQSRFELLLVGRQIAKIDRVLGDLAAAFPVSDNVADVVGADVVLALTSSPSARLKRAWLRDGAIVIDAAEPGNVGEADARAWDPLVRVCRGGRVLVPDYHCTYDFRLEGPQETFACLAETYLFAREGLRQHSVGLPDPKSCEHLERVAERHGVRPRPLFAAPAEQGSPAAGVEGRRRHPGPLRAVASRTSMSSFASSERRRRDVVHPG